MMRVHETTELVDGQEVVPPGKGTATPGRSLTLDHTERLIGYAVPLGIIAVPWVIALSLVWRRAGGITGEDLARLIRAAASTLPEERRHWGEAMAAELPRVTGRRARLWFTLGCVRALLAAHRLQRLPGTIVSLSGGRRTTLVGAAASVTIAAAMLAAPYLGDTGSPSGGLGRPVLAALLVLALASLTSALPRRRVPSRTIQPFGDPFTGRAR
ncbi:hypothetical protein [Thermocatellispora tengchongensis]